MPSQAAHKAKAERLLALYHGTPDTLVEVRVITLFYCGVHIVEMVAAAGAPPCHHESHPPRTNFLKRSHPKALEHYRPLACYGWDARYVPAPLDITADQVTNYLFRKRLDGLMKWAEGILGPAGKLVPPGSIEREAKMAPAIKY